MIGFGARRLFVGAAILAGITLPGTLRAQDAALIEAAKKEGELVWYTGMIMNLVVRPVAEAFEKKYGIKVKPAGVGDSEVLLRLTSEARANKREGDVFDSPGTVIPPLIAADLIEPYKPSTAENFPPELKDEKGRWTALFALYLTTGFNTELVDEAEAPKTFEDLLDPKWRDKMVWTDTRTISGPAGFIANVLKTMGDEAGMAYLKKLAEQKIVRVPANQRVILDQVIAGQYSIGLMIYNHHTVISQKQGAPIAWVKMEPLVANLGVVGMARQAPHPNAAKLFLEFLFSKEGQTVMRDAGYPPARPDVPAKDPSISPGTGQFKTTLLTPETTAEPLAGWLKIYDELFK